MSPAAAANSGCNEIKPKFSRGASGWEIFLARSLTVKVNLVPFPGWLATSMWPP